jgi:Sigma-54 interaction domain
MVATVANLLKLPQCRGFRSALPETPATRIMAVKSLRPAWRSIGAREHHEPIEWPFLVGNSAEVRVVLSQIEKVSRSDAPVLIQGETGSGKELAARAIRVKSSRRNGPFVAVNCGSIPDGLIETELFGNGARAFTDARQARDGVVAHAQGGTLFLDEIDALTAKGQVALLRSFRTRAHDPAAAQPSDRHRPARSPFPQRVLQEVCAADQDASPRNHGVDAPAFVAGQRPRARARNPRWRPTLPGRRRGTFGIVDFLTLAGVDPARRGQ